MKCFLLEPSNKVKTQKLHTKRLLFSNLIWRQSTAILEIVKTAVVIQKVMPFVVFLSLLAVSKILVLNVKTKQDPSSVRIAFVKLTLLTFIIAWR